MNASNISTPDARFAINSRIPRRKAESPTPLSDSQQLYLSELVAHNSLRVPRMQAAAVRVLGLLSSNLLREAIEFVANRHESLRTRISFASTEAKQILRPEPISHLRELTVSTEEDAVRAGIEYFAQKIDPTVDSLFDALLLKLSGREHILLVGLHRLIGDGASCIILNKEMWQVYNQLSEGRPASLPELLIQFPDYAAWQADTFQSRRSNHEPYWSERSAGAPTVEIPLDFGGTAPDPTTAAVFNAPFGKSLTTRLGQLAIRERTLLPIVVLTAYVIAMSRYCDQTDLTIPFVSHGRSRHFELQGAIGRLVNLLPLRVTALPGSRLLDVLREVRREFVSAASHEEYVPPLPSGCNFNLLFNWGGLTTYMGRWSIDQRTTAIEQLRVQPFLLPQRQYESWFPQFSSTASGIVLTIGYLGNQLRRDTVARLASNIRDVATCLATQPESSLDSISIS